MTVEESRAASLAAAHLLEGTRLERVRYVGLNFATDDVNWDMGSWHWPQEGVELVTDEGATFYAIWSGEVTHFNLVLRQGPISDVFVPARDGTARIADVSSHPAWRPLLEGPLESLQFADGIPDDPPVVAPMALRLGLRESSAWIVAARLKDELSSPGELTAEDLFVGLDEVIVLFGDDCAARVGLQLG
jgi:hypothetical protein